MKSAFKPQDWEDSLYTFWEGKGYFRAEKNPVGGKENTFSIILPPPNANADLHVGHAMYVYEDIMIRFNKLRGKSVLWLPGADHAGFETQYVYEKHLTKQGKSRFDFDRKTLFKDIWDFVMQNRENMENQLRRLGFALDWSKKKFTMDEDIVRIVHETFKKLFDDGLVYRGTRLVNYSPHDGTAFSDLEVDYRERQGKLWYLKYPIKDSDETISVATTRPETMLGDTAVAVHPDDKRYKNLVGKMIIHPITGREIPIVADDVIDAEFGSGAVKITPAHDHVDWDIGKRHDLEVLQVIGPEGTMTENAGDFAGLYVNKARRLVVERLEQDGVLEKEEDYTHRVAVGYKTGKPIEPMPVEQWFIKVRPLADEAKKKVESGDIQVHPERFKSQLIDWLDRFHDWNISRQIVWGIQIPAYRCVEKNEWFVNVDKPEKCEKCGSCAFEQDEDTFDTWFSSGQWPFATLQSQDLFDDYYPTSVMETGYDILPWWVARMIMLGCYATGDVPFQNVFLHGMVRDKKGMKMSKSKGNVINPMSMLDQFGADALRGTLIFQSKEGGDVNFSQDKIIGMRNFSNKIWNIGRFIFLNKSGELKPDESVTFDEKKAKETLEKLKKEFAEVKQKAIDDIEDFKFSIAFNDLYEFLWHRYADFYIEELKDPVRSGNIEVLEGLEDIYTQTLKLLHPYLPFVTEAVWKSFYGEETSILDEVIQN